MAAALIRFVSETKHFVQQSRHIQTASCMYYRSYTELKDFTPKFSKGLYAKVKKIFGRQEPRPSRRALQEHEVWELLQYTKKKR